MNDLREASPVAKPLSISGITGQSRETGVKEALEKIRAGTATEMGSCGGVSGGWGN